MTEDSPFNSSWKQGTCCDLLYPLLNTNFIPPMSYPHPTVQWSSAVLVTTFINNVAIKGKDSLINVLYFQVLPVSLVGRTAIGSASSVLPDRVTHAT